MGNIHPPDLTSFDESLTTNHVLKLSRDDLETMLKESQVNHTMSQVHREKKEAQKIRVNGREITFSTLEEQLQLLAQQQYQTSTPNAEQIHSMVNEYVALNEMSEKDQQSIAEYFEKVSEHKVQAEQSIVKSVSLTPSRLISTQQPLELSTLFHGTHQSPLLKSSLEKNNTATSFVKWDKEAISEGLIANVESIATELLGEPVSKEHGQCRFGSNKGSLIVTIDGEKKGLWYDHQTGKGGNLLQLIQEQRGCDFKEALSIAGDYLGMAPLATQKFTDTEKTHIDLCEFANDNLPQERQKTIAYAKQLIHESQPLEGTLAQRYLKEHRSINASLSDNLRYHPKVWDSASKANYPALMITARNETGRIQGAQVIYLNSETAQKAELDNPKRSFGIIKGSTIPVHEGGAMLAVAEGVETAASVAQANPEVTVFASLGSFTNFSALGLKGEGHSVILCADHDTSDNASNTRLEKAAEELSKKGFNVLVTKPDEQGQDFNDVLKEQGIEAVQAMMAKATLLKVAASHLSMVDKENGQNKEFSRSVQRGKKSLRQTEIER